MALPSQKAGLLPLCGKDQLSVFGVMLLQDIVCAHMHVKQYCRLVADSLNLSFLLSTVAWHSQKVVTYACSSFLRRSHLRARLCKRQPGSAQRQ